MSHVNAIKRSEYVRFLKSYESYLRDSCYFKDQCKSTFSDYLQLDLNERLIALRKGSGGRLCGQFSPKEDNERAESSSSFSSNRNTSMPRNSECERIIEIRSKPGERSYSDCENESLVYSNLVDQLLSTKHEDRRDLSRVGLRRSFKNSNTTGNKEHAKRQRCNEKTVRSKLLELTNARERRRARKRRKVGRKNSE